MRKLLWTSLEIFAARREKSACALVALAESLRKELGAGSAFGRLYATCAEADPEAFTRVWSDPSAYAWVRTAFDLVTESRGAPPTPRGLAAARAYVAADPEAALAAHLDAFARFALAVAFVAGRELALVRPLRVSLPCALPGTPLALEGAGALELEALEGGRLRARRDGRGFELALAAGAAAEGIRVSEAPVVRDQGCALRLQPQALAMLPGFERLRPALEAGPDFQREGAPWLAGALDVLARHAPATLDVLRAHTTLLALKPPASGEFTHFTHPDLPGATVLSLVREPFELAEALLQEVHHDRLFHLEELEAIVADPEGGIELLGVFHAAYVQVAVARFWHDALRAGDARAEIQAHGRSRLARVLLQLDQDLPRLERRADAMTGYGDELLLELQYVARGVRRDAQALG